MCAGRRRKCSPRGTRLICCTHYASSRTATTHAAPNKASAVVDQVLHARSGVVQIHQQLPACGAALRGRPRLRTL